MIPFAHLAVMLDGFFFGSFLVPSSVIQVLDSTSNYPGLNLILD